MFSARGLFKAYGSASVIAGVDLDLTPGCTSILIGPSGCGKSTLLRILLGLIRPDAGTIRFGDEILGPASMNRIRHRVGYVIQDGGLFPHLTAAGNASLLASELGWSAPRIRRRLEELAGLTRFPVSALGRYPLELSGGQRQRVALIRALMCDPEVLLLDEPLASLDQMVRYELQSDLRQVFLDLRKTTLLVTHDLAEAGYFGDSLMLMRDGRIIQRGSLRELTEAPAEPFVRQFFRSQRAPAWAAWEPGT